jgi:hypothetical protein
MTDQRTPRQSAAAAGAEHRLLDYLRNNPNRLIRTKNRLRAEHFKHGSNANQFASLVVCDDHYSISPAENEHLTTMINAVVNGAQPRRQQRQRQAAGKGGHQARARQRKQQAEPPAAKPDNTVGSSKGTISERAAAKVRPLNSSNRHVRLYHQDLETPAFASLDCKARALLIEFHREYNGHNNGEIVVSIKEAMQRLGIGSTHTMLRAFQALEDRGFIVATSRGAFHAGAKHSTKWELTSWPLAKGAEPRRLFRKWRSRLHQGVGS